MRAFARGRMLASFCVALLLVLSIPVCAFATPEDEDQTLLTDEEIAAAIDAGMIGSADDATIAQFYSGDAALTATGSKKLAAYAGSDRYETSALEALAGWTSSTRVIIATGAGWADALAVSGLAGALDCPLLLTEPGSLPASISEALQTLGASSAIIVGGTNAVSEDVVSELEALGITVEQRLDGADRYDTQLLIYEYGIELGVWGQSSTIAVACGAEDGFADALSISAVAFAQQMPVFLCNAAGELSDVQQSTLYEGIDDGIIANAVIAGGTVRVSDYTEGVLRGALGVAGGSVDRLAGADRYATAVDIATWAVSEGCLAWDGAAITNGITPYDALGGGILQGKNGSVLLFANDSNTATAIEALSGQTLTGIVFLGGKAAVSMQVRMEFADELGFAYSDIEGLKVYVDAGHGWNSSNNNVMDWGASGNGYQEYTLNAELANLVGTELSSTYGIDVYVNDQGGWFKLRQAEAESLGCDMLISIHFNAADSDAATGTESYIHSVHAQWKSADLQSKIHTRLVSALGLVDRGQKAEEWAVCGGNLPAVLLEIGFITNADDMSTYVAKKAAVAQAIAAGIAD